MEMINPKHNRVISTEKKENICYKNFSNSEERDSLRSFSNFPSTQNSKFPFPKIDNDSWFALFV